MVLQRCELWRYLFEGVRCLKLVYSRLQFWGDEVIGRCAFYGECHTSIACHTVWTIGESTQQSRKSWPFRGGCAARTMRHPLLEGEHLTALSKPEVFRLRGCTVVHAYHSLIRWLIAANHIRRSPLGCILPVLVDTVKVSLFRSGS